MVLHLKDQLHVHDIDFNKFDFLKEYRLLKSLQRAEERSINPLASSRVLEVSKGLE